MPPKAFRPVEDPDHHRGSAVTQKRPDSLSVVVRAGDVDQLIVAIWHARRILSRWMVGHESKRVFRFTSSMVDQLERHMDLLEDARQGGGLRGNVADMMRGVERDHPQLETMYDKEPKHG